jgi:MSHA pilin protein MshA
MPSQKRQTGFTLIELIIVIVLLGILAATTAPRFINLQVDANKAALEGLGGAISSAANLVYAKAVIQNVVNDAASNVDIDSDGVNDVATIYGYPSGNRTTGISNVVDLGDDWAYSDVFGGGQLYITFSSLTGFSGRTNNNIPITQTRCYLTYRPSTSSNVPPTVSYTTTGC